MDKKIFLCLGSLTHAKYKHQALSGGTWGLFFPVFIDKEDQVSFILLALIIVIAARVVTVYISLC